MMRTRMLAVLLVLCAALAVTPGRAESHSKAWLDRWAEELFREARELSLADEEPDVPLSGRLILAYTDLKGKCSVYSKFSGPKKDPRPKDPFFQPVWSNGQPLFREIPASCWAKTVEECDWLIVYGGFETSRNKNYYGAGIDRVVVTTRVCVLDPAEKRIVLEETIGTDAPGVRTSTPTGRVMIDEAQSYIISLIMGKE